MIEYQRGDVVVLLAYKGAHLTRRIWRDSGGSAVAICDEDNYQRALATQTEARCVGWHREDVLELVSRELAADAATSAP